MSQMVLVPYVPVTEEPSVWQRMFTDAPSATLLQASYPVPGAARTVSADPDVLTVPDAALAGPAVPRTADATAAAVIAVQRPNRAIFRASMALSLARTTPGGKKPPPSIGRMALFAADVNAAGGTAH